MALRASGNKNSKICSSLIFFFSTKTKQTYHFPSAALGAGVTAVNPKF